MNSFPDFLATSEVLHKNSLPSASILITGNAESRNDADSFLADYKSPLPGSWLIEAKENRLSTTLRIANFPTIVLIAKDGTILFHGDPGANKFWLQLKKLSPNITRPHSPALNSPLPEEQKTSGDKGEK